MRIAVLLTSLGFGGAEKQAIEVAEQLAARGHIVRIFSLLARQHDEWVPDLPVCYLDLGPGILSLPGAFVRAAKAVRAFSPDVLHCHCFHGNLFGRLLKLVLPNTLVVSTIHNVYEGGLGRMLLYRLTNRLAQRSVFVCEAGADRYMKLRAVSRGRAHVLSNGVDLSEFVPDPCRRVRLRQRMHAGNHFIWLAAGRLATAKDYPTLLRAFAQVRKVLPHVTLWIAGQGSGAARSELQALASELGIDGFVRWLGLRRDIPDLLDAADGFVLSSAWEGMPLVLAEAMAMEKPIAATAVGGVAELVGPRVGLVPPNEPASLALAMIEVMRTPAHLLISQGRASRQRIERNFTIEAATDRWETLYSELIGIMRRRTTPPLDQTRTLA